MKQKPTFKSVLLVASFFSLFAFIFVNWHPDTTRECTQDRARLVQVQLEDESRNMPAPDITILEKLWELTRDIILKK